MQAAVFRLKAGGLIGRHPARSPQILAVLDGCGEVAGSDGAFVRVEAGDAVFFPEGEEHETRTSDGMVALVIEGRDIAPFR